MSEPNPYAGQFSPHAGQPNRPAQYPPQFDPTAQLPPQQEGYLYDGREYQDAGRREPEPRRSSNADGAMWAQYCRGILLAVIGAVAALFLVNLVGHLITGLFTNGAVPIGDAAARDSVLPFTSDSAVILAACATILAGGLYVAIFKSAGVSSRDGYWRGAQIFLLVVAPLSVMIFPPLQPGTGPIIYEAISRFVVALVIIKGVALAGKSLSEGPVCQACQGSGHVAAVRA